MKRISKAKNQRSTHLSSHNAAEALALTALFAALAVVDERLDVNNEPLATTWLHMLADSGAELTKSKQGRALEVAELLLGILNVEARR